jgi:hypothetical protein
VKDKAIGICQRKGERKSNKSKEGEADSNKSKEGEADSNRSKERRKKKEQ